MVVFPTTKATGKHMVFIGDPSQNDTTPDGRPKPPKDYLGLALVSLLCCCFPFGIIALIKSLEVCMSKVASFSVTIAL